MTDPLILLVEDEDHLAETLWFNLRAEGYEPIRAADLASARAALTEHRFALILLDVMLPDGSGFELAAELRARGERVPVLMLTARTTTSDVVHGLEQGADDYLGKPFALEELFSRMAALLRRQSWQTTTNTATADGLIVVGACNIDSRTGNADTLRGPVQLTDVELKLLRYFVAHPDQDLGRDRLLEAVWGLPSSSGARSRTLDTFVMRLRKIIEADPADPMHFRTVYGLGYRFTP